MQVRSPSPGCFESPGDPNAMPSRLPRASWLPFALCALLATPAAADPPGFAFLEVPGGARAASMGGAYASLARGAEAAFWNPAGLGQFDGTQITATHTETYD